MLWEVQTGRRLITMFEGATATITSISWLADGKHVAVGAGNCKSIALSTPCAV
jgi:WD40 repeat protein